MPEPSHLPPSNDRQAVRVDYPAYPAAPEPPYARLLDRLAVRTVTAIEYHCAPAWGIPPRRIVDDMFFLILGGQAAMRVEGRESTLRPGDMAHWRRGRTHSASHDPKRPIRVIALHYTAVLDGAAQLADVAGFPDRFRLGLEHPLAEVVRDCAREYALLPLGWNAGLEAATTRLLLGLLRGFAPEMSRVTPPPAGLARVVPALDAMRESLAAPLAMPALASRCGLSPAQFRRVFAGAVGCSPIVHLRRLRIAEACRLLRLTTGSVESIARQVGYAETAFFARTFRAHMGMPPGRWRSGAGP
jgi:AraC-like DNA-binding protein